MSGDLPLEEEWAWVLQRRSVRFDHFAAYMPQATEIAFLCDLVERTSRILHRRDRWRPLDRDGDVRSQHFGGADASIWIHPNSNVWPNSTSARLWFPTESMDISQDFLMWPTIMAHELSHYLYDLRDEYNNGSACQNNIGTQASIMESYGWGNYTRWTDAGGTELHHVRGILPDYTSAAATLQQGEPTAVLPRRQPRRDPPTTTRTTSTACSRADVHGPPTPSQQHRLWAHALGAGGPTGAAPAAHAAVLHDADPGAALRVGARRSGSMIGRSRQLKIGANLGRLRQSARGVRHRHLLRATRAPMSRGPRSPAGPAQTTWRTDRHAI